MTWVSWRLQRTEMLIAVGVLALIAALLVPTGIEMASSYHRDALSACLSANPSFACSNRIASFLLRYGPFGSLLSLFTLVPGLIGVLLAAPFILELENGTYRLAWTQSVTRRRWIATKLALPFLAAPLIVGVLIVLTTWWRTPLVELNGRMDTSTYDSEGTVSLGYTLFALGLALAVGVIWRRAVAAVTVAFSGYVAVRIFVDAWLRNRLVSPLKATWNSAAAQPANLNHANIISQTGRGPVTVIRSASGSLGSRAVIRVGHAPTTMHAVYQPASHFWPLQVAETGLFVGVALLLIIFAAWWTDQRTA